MGCGVSATAALIVRVTSLDCSSAVISTTGSGAAFAFFPYKAKLLSSFLSLGHFLVTEVGGVESSVDLCTISQRSLCSQQALELTNNSFREGISPAPFYHPRLASRYQGQRIQALSSPRHRPMSNNLCRLFETGKEEFWN